MRRVNGGMVELRLLRLSLMIFQIVCGKNILLFIENLQSYRCIVFGSFLIEIVIFQGGLCCKLRKMKEMNYCNIFMILRRLCQRMRWYLFFLFLYFLFESRLLELLLKFLLVKVQNLILCQFCIGLQDGFGVK